MPVTRTPGPAKAQLEALTQSLDGVEVRAGWFETAKYPDGTPVAYVAAIQEFGVPPKNIPARSFMRPTVAAKSNEWNAKLRSLLKRATDGGMALEALGAVVAGDFREAIINVNEPPLAPATLHARRRRGNASTKPLSDTRVLMQTLTHHVSRGTT